MNPVLAHAPPPAIETLQIQGYSLRARWQPGRGVPLVLCNGWGGNIETLDPLLQALGDRATLCFDVPGIGGSSLPKWPLRLPHLATLVEQLWQHYGIDEVDVAGYSWGGLLAQELAKRNPKTVRRLVLLATSPGHLMVPASPSILLAFADTHWLPVLLHPSRAFDRNLLCRVGPRLFGGERLRRNPMALLPNLKHLRKPSVRAMAWQVAAAFGWSSLPWLRRLSQPTLILAGRDDRVVNPLNSIILQHLLANARLQWVDGGHLFPILDAPQATATYIIQFLDEHPKVVPMAGRRKQPARRAV